MTVASEENRSGPYIGNGSATVFSYGFRILNEAHIEVVRTENNTDTVLALGTDYTVSGVGDAGGGSITTTSAPTAAQTITLLRNVPFTQETDLENQGAYFAETIEASLDLAAMRDQQLSELLSRAVVMPASQSADDIPGFVSDIQNAAANAASAIAARDAAAASASALGNQVHQYDTLALAIAATIPVGINVVRTLGRGTVGLGGAVWTRLISAPGAPRSWHWQSTVDSSWWIMAAPVGWIVSPAQFGTGLTNTAVQDALDYLQALGVSGGRVVCEPNQTYTGTTAPKVWNGLTLDLNGSKIVTTLSGGGAYGIRVGDNAEICNGWAHSIDGGITDSQFIFGPAISLGVANASPGNLVSAPDYFATGRPRVRNMKLSCTRMYCPVLQGMGDLDVLIENIEIPDSATCTGIHLDWSDIGGSTVAAGTGPGGSYINDLERVTKWNAAYNNGNGTMYTTHPRGVIRKIRAGSLTVPAVGDSGSRAVRLSACRNVIVDDVNIKECTLPAFDHVGGDFGFEFARRADQRNAVRGIRLRNLSADLCHYYGIFVDTFADNIQNAVNLGYANGVDTYMNGDVVIENVSIVGPFNDTDDGIRIQNAKGVKVIDANVVGFYQGVGIEDNTENVDFVRGRIWRNRGAGINIKNVSTIKSLTFYDVDCELNATVVTGSDAVGINVRGGVNILIQNCHLGAAGEDTQAYAITVGTAATRVSIIENEIRGVKSGGAALNLPAGNMDPLWVVRGNIYIGAAPFMIGASIIPVERTPRVPGGGIHTRAIATAAAMSGTALNTPTYGTFVEGDLIEVVDANSTKCALARRGSSAWATLVAVP